VSEKRCKVSLATVVGSALYRVTRLKPRSRRAQHSVLLIGFHSCFTREETDYTYLETKIIWEGQRRIVRRYTAFSYKMLKQVNQNGSEFHTVLVVLVLCSFPNSQDETKLPSAHRPQNTFGV
jgi:hypothetical protein